MSVDSDFDKTSIKDLVRKRGNIKTRLTNYTKYVSQFENVKFAPEKRIHFQLRLLAAESIYKDFLGVQTSIEDNVSDEELETQMSEREAFEDSYFSVVAVAKSMLEEEVINSPTAKISDGNAHQSIKLPTISIPTFDGSYERWLEFRDTYLSLVHNSTEISHIQKFHYLKSSLSGSAALVIDSLEFSAANYKVAWELITNRYNNSRLLIHNHVKALFSIQSLAKESPALLRKLIDTILKNIRALKLLGEPTDSWDTLIIYIVVSKLDNVTEREWEQHKSTLLRGDSTAKLTLNDLLGFLKDRADMLETLIVSHSKGSDSRKQSAAVVPKVHCNVSTTKPSTKQRSFRKQCLLCNANHSLYACQRFLDLTHDEKTQFITNKKLCENCLRTGHSLIDCRFGPCRKCNIKHNTLLHRDGSTENTVTKRAVTLLSAGIDKQCESTGSTAMATEYAHMQNTLQTQSHVACEDSNALQASSMQPVLLSTALVEIHDDNTNNRRTTRVLLDSGSQRCIITKSLCESLNVPLIQSTQQITGVGNTVTQCTQTCNVTLLSLNGNYKTNIQCLVLPEITSTMQSMDLTVTELRIPDYIQLADPKFHEAQPIELLIGADLFWDLLDEGRIRLAKGPYLQNTRLGWVISGPIFSKTPQNTNSQCFFTQTIDAQLRRFWELEELSPPVDAFTDEERACENHFIQTTKREADGRFCVTIPFKESPETLGETRKQAERRFVSLEKRLERSPDLKNMYKDFMSEYSSLGHMTRVDSYGDPHFFMPHHGVLRIQSTSTKLRAVFDASARSSTGKSLNDLQMVGPAIQGDLLSILLRFRLHAYVACADIEKMYRQCLVDKSQRELQLILWRDSPSDAFNVYQLNTVTYGTASAPFLAVRCLKQLALECADPTVARTINEDFYVDDLCTGADTIEEITHICRETEKQLNLGCLPLRKWVFNYDCDTLQFDSICASRELSLGEHTHSKTLGLGWYNKTDELHFHTELTPNLKPLTKRVILSELSQIFDPLGLLSPTIMIAKILLQKLWLLKLTWDDPVPSDVKHSWELFVSNLSELNSLRIPRHVKGNEPLSIELHLFTDASQNAFGSCAYVRTFCRNGSVCVRLICSKGKVMPLKPISIPRAELCSALLGAKLYTKIKESLRCRFDRVMFWTDSTIVLGWLRMAPRLLKTFVQTRTSLIQEMTNEHSWHHVRSKENPADLVSRGLHLDDLRSCVLWWEGPAFLRDPDFDCSSVGAPPRVEPQDLPEVNIKSLALSCQVKADIHIFNFMRFSNFIRMTRACAYVLRFIFNAHNKHHDRRTADLSTTELVQSKHTLARLSQMESFPEDYQLLLTNKTLDKSSKLLGLNLFMDENSVLRVGGRLQNSDFHFDKKHPILISASHHLALLLFRSQHVALMHAGPQLLLYSIREEWWPIGGRNLARKVVHDCVTCARLRAKTLKPIMGNLPKERLMPGFPFMRCGVDYAGPVSVLNRKGRGAKTEKAYICLFICFATRAIHLELVGDLSSDAYLLALKRFISRRGKPAEIFSDNGKNFVGLKNNFAQFLSSCSNEITEYAASQDIKFSFIPPYAPHFGGLWEAGIKSCKGHVRRVVRNANLTFEEFSTVLAQIEAILNSRPLTPMSSEPNDFLPLSPGHFLVGRPLTAPASNNLDTVPMNRLSRYEKVEQMRQHFWARWSKEYVSELQTRCKWKEGHAGLTKDTLVVIKEDNLPPLKWLLGRIINTVPGKDGVSRVADVRTATGVIRRAFSKICPLPLESHQSS